MERAEFGSKLKTHDWYYAYSDDHRVWRRGNEASGRLRVAREELNCPFDMGILKQWAHNMERVNLLHILLSYQQYDLEL